MKKALKPQKEFLTYLEENPDPLNIKEVGLKEFTLEEVEKHNEAPSIWIIYKFGVYDITKYVEYHPGGVEILKPYFGKDCTLPFATYHPWVNFQNILGRFRIGTLSF